MRLSESESSGRALWWSGAEPLLPGGFRHHVPSAHTELRPQEWHEGLSLALARWAPGQSSHRAGGVATAGWCSVTSRLELLGLRFSEPPSCVGRAQSPGKDWPLGPRKWLRVHGGLFRSCSPRWLSTHPLGGRWAQMDAFQPAGHRHRHKCPMRGSGAEGLRVGGHVSEGRGKASEALLQAWPSTLCVPLGLRPPWEVRAEARARAPHAGWLTAAGPSSHGCVDQLSGVSGNRAASPEGSWRPSCP